MKKTQMLEQTYGDTKERPTQEHVQLRQFDEGNGQIEFVEPAKTEHLLWQRSYRLALELYAATRDFPKLEMYGLVQQIRRAGIKVPATLCRYQRLRNVDDRTRTLHFLLSDLDEIGVYLEFAHDLGYFVRDADMVVNESGFIDNNVTLSEQRYKQLTQKVDDIKRTFSHLVDVNMRKAST